MFRRLPCLFGFALAALSSAQSTVWARRIEYNGNNDFGSRVVVDASNNVYVAGSTNGSSDSDLLITKYSPTGSRLWIKKLGVSGRHDSAAAVRLDPQGNLIVGANSSVFYDDSDYLVLKLSTTGQQLWRRIYRDTSSRGNHLTSLSVDASGNVVVTGSTSTDPISRDVITIKYGPDGTRKWIRRFGSPYMTDSGEVVETDAAGSIYVAGHTGGFSSDRDVLLMKYAPNGQLLWSQRFDGLYGEDESADDMKLDSAGRPVVLARTDSWSSSDLAILKFNPNGAMIWSRIYAFDDGRAESNGRLDLDASDNVLVAASSKGEGGNDVLAVKYAANGVFRWAYYYNSPYGFDDDVRDAVVDAKGSLFVTGVSYQSTDLSTGMDFLTLKFSPLGALGWAERYDTEWHMNDGAQSVALCPDGNVVVTGFSVLPSIDIAPDADVYTIKYRSSG
ncbi:MAG TPA: SBBP repeat-containing protein [Fimbriimonas sp.]